MKEYLKIIDALQRACDLIEKGAEMPSSVVMFYVDDCINAFKSQFGPAMGAERSLLELENAKLALANNNSAEFLRCIRSANVLYRKVAK